MRTKQLACFGDSITGGYFARYHDNTYPNVLLHELQRHDARDRWNLLTTDSSSSWPRLGQIWRTYRQFAASQPDVVVFQGGENDASSTVASLAASAGAGATTLTFNANITAGRAYILTDGTAEEVVIPQAAATVTGTRVIRGAMGTTAQDWPAATTVRTWNQSTAVGLPAFVDTYEYALRDILSTTGDRTIVLVGGLWFAAQTDLNTVALKTLVDGLTEDYPRIEFVPYETADGTSLTASGNTLTAASTYTGPTARIDQANLTNVATSVKVTSTSDIEPGDLLLLTTTSAVTAPTAGTSEIVQVASKDDATRVITFDTTTANAGGAVRNKLGSTARAFVSGNRVCKLAHGTMNPRIPWLTLGGADFASLMCQYDTHPNDKGQREIGYAFYRGYQRARSRIGGA